MTALEADQGLKDPLTGMYSRTHLTERLRDEVDRARRYETSFALLILDLDNFKSVNDAFGHLRGDQVLVELGARLQKITRDSDVIFRYGGDEFVLLLPHTTKSQALALAGRLLQGVQSTSFAGDPPVSVSLSIGVAVFSEDGQTPELLFKQADRHLYEAKRAGRGQVVATESASPSTTEVNESERLIERDKASETMYQFLDVLFTRKRGILIVTGPRGVGKSRFLSDVVKSARLRGYAALVLHARPALRTRMYGALTDSRQHFDNLLPGGVEKNTFVHALAEYTRANNYSGFLVAVDDLPELDSATLDLLRVLMSTSTMPVVGLVCTASLDSIQRVTHWDVPVKETLRLEPFSPQGVRIWLRGRLQWEAPRAFIEWLHRETQGLPGFLQHGLTYLIERHILNKTDTGWSLKAKYRQIRLGEQIGFVTNDVLNNLPTALSPFVGREEEIQRVKDLIEEKRMLTLLGPGGIGKTRLALQAAAEMSEQFEGGSYFVPLASVNAVDFIAPRIAEALRFSFSGPIDVETQLLNYLREKNLLLVIDSFEHLTEGTELLVTLLTQSPRLKIIVTSRERLGLPEESVFELHGLSFPVDDETVPDSERYGAVQLFQQRARASAPDWKLNEENVRCVARICRLVEGMPLGIELAAAWASTFSCREIADAIEGNLDFLSKSPATFPERQKSLRAVFDYFWGMLTEDEHRMVRQMSVFRGGVQRDAAGKVAGTALFFLSALVERAFLAQTPTRRYTMHELLRQYAQEKLEAVPQERSEAYGRHCRYFAAYLQHCELDMKGPRQRAALDEINDEIENIRLAWIWAVQYRWAAQIEQCVESLARFYEIRGWYQEADSAFRQAVQALELISNIESGQAQARCQMALGKLMWVKGDFRQMLVMLESARSLWEALGDPYGAVRAIAAMGDAHVELGDSPQALDSYRQALALARELGDRRLLGEMLGHLGLFHEDQRDFPKALDCLEQSIQIARELGDNHALLRVLGDTGFIYLEQSEITRALAYFSEGLQIAIELGERYVMGKLAREMGRAYAKIGDPRRALSGYAYQMQTALDIDNQRDLGVTLVYIAAAYTLMGRATDANRVSRLAVAQCRAVNVPYWLCEALYGAVTLCVKQERYAEALSLNDEALSLAGHAGGRKDIQFKAQLVSAHLRVALGQIDLPTAIHEVEQLLLHKQLTEDEQAAAEYGIWRLDTTQESHSRNAVKLYQALYTRTPIFEYKQRFEELIAAGLQLETGCLPDLPPLPELPEIVTRVPLDLEALLNQVEVHLYHLNRTP